MKTISNKLHIFIALSISIAIVASTSIQATAYTLGSGIGGNEKTSSPACTKITALRSTSNATVKAHTASLKTDFANRLSNIASHQADVDQQATTFRSSITDRFDAKITELKQKTGLTATQITAIDTYTTAIKTAELTREQTISSAMLTYRTSLQNTVELHQQNLISATNAFELQTNEAFANAETNCGDSTAIATLKQTMNTVKHTFKLAQQSNTVGDTIKQLAQTRNSTIKTANTTFTKSATAYTTTLAALFQ